MTTSRNTRNGLRGLIALVALSAMFALPATAPAQTITTGGGGANCTPTDDQYAPPTDFLKCRGIESGGGGDGTIAGVTASGTDPVEASGSELPFTGLDVMTLLALAAVLTGTGLVLRRLTSPGAGRGS
jgi:hypothetical protein